MTSIKETFRVSIIDDPLFIPKYSLLIPPPRQLQLQRAYVINGAATASAASVDLVMMDAAGAEYLLITDAAVIEVLAGFIGACRDKQEAKGD